MLLAKHRCSACYSRVWMACEVADPSAFAPTWRGHQPIPQVEKQATAASERGVCGPTMSEDNFGYGSEGEAFLSQI